MASGIPPSTLKRGLEPDIVEEKNTHEEHPTKRFRLSDPAEGTIPADLQHAIRELYIPAGMKFTNEPKRERESEEYGACRFSFENRNVVYRVAKTTPTYIGQFVALWKRSNSKTVPIDTADNVQYVVINSSDDTHQGQFIFDKEVLLQQGIMSAPGKKGKNGFRVFPPWCKPDTPGGIKAQKWQSRYYVNYTKPDQQAYQLVRRLFKFI